MQTVRNSSSGNSSLAEETENSIELLKLYLVASSDLHVQVKQAHWSLKELGVEPLNKTFSKIAAEIAFLANCIEEHAAGFGIAKNPRNAEFARRSFLTHYARGISDVQQYVFAIYGALVAFGQSMRHASNQAREFGDLKTASLFADISSVVDGQIRIVESHIASTQGNGAATHDGLQDTAAAVE